MMKIIIYDLVAIGVGMYLGSEIRTKEGLCVFLIGSVVLIAILFVRWMKARKRFWRAMKDQREDQ